jgi:hypothetical protein
MTSHIAEILLVLDRVPQGRRIRFVDGIDQAVSAWTQATRVSPVFAPHSSVDHSYTLSLEGPHHLTFVGPYPPEDLIALWGSRADIWLSLGVFNNLVRTADDAVAAEVVEWAKEHGLLFERWTTQSGIIEHIEQAAPRATASGWRRVIATTSRRRIRRGLAPLLNEYAALLSSGVARAEQTVPTMVDDLLAADPLVRSVIAHDPELTVEEQSHEIYDLLVTLNAALSRLTSQTFSGASPITETECHFWTHSLLGTGIANIGLWKLCARLQFVLGRERIPERLSALANYEGEIKLENLDDNDPFWNLDRIGEVELTPPDTKEVMVPLVPYFSGRDGFKTTLHTISAPLVAIEACNSKQWTLETLTHELSHIVIRGALGEIYPTTMQDIESAYATMRVEPRNLLESIRRYLLMTICFMEQDRENLERVFDTPDYLQQMLVDWHAEVEEILTHVFDFQYFYGANARRYVEGIWTSWSVIPNIGMRVPEYVVRTLCAVLSNHLEYADEMEERARKDVERYLRRLNKGKRAGRYVNDALSYLSGSKWEAVYKQLVARRGLVRIAKAFLFSEKCSARIRAEYQVSSGNPEHEGYNLARGDFTRLRIDNPIRFVGSYTSGTAASHEASLWMLYVLAFGDHRKADRER